MKKYLTYFLLVILGSFFLYCEKAEILTDPADGEKTEEGDSPSSDAGEEDSSSGDESIGEDPAIDDFFNDPTGETVKVAFIGDQGDGTDAINVLTLIANENADVVFHQGDFDYYDDPDSWDELISNTLGENFPYFASIGNHDVAAWPLYQTKLQQRLDRIEGALCTGDLGIKAACTYRGLFFILSGVGTMGSGHDTYIQEQLAATDSRWRICSWHKDQRLMQVGGKSDEVGWAVYDRCREGGAIIATAHEHSYSRTHLMSDFQNQVIADTANTLVITEGETFAFVSGLGGASVRSQNNTLAANPWWASIYTSSQNADYGALFCTFNVDGNLGEAACYFKDIAGNSPDQFFIQSGLY